MNLNRRSWLGKMVLAFAAIGISKNKIFASTENHSLDHEANPLLHKPGNTPDELILGAFSMSLNVKDLKASKEFYENIGFNSFGGGMEQNYLIMKNGNAVIGLFQGMFAGNILTFNPGWDENAMPLKKYTDVREIQKYIKEKGIKPAVEADENSKGPAYFTISDPDGNQILFDQHL